MKSSCKRRGFCPGCGARRMAETAAHLVEHVIPRVPVRQWVVLSFPIPLRWLFAAHPELLAPVLRIVHRVIATFLIQQAGLQRTEAHTGAVTLIQRFGSAANLNIHLHCLVLDGVYRTTTEGLPIFHTVHAPTATELQALLNRIIKRIMKFLTRKGYLIEEQGMTYLTGTDADLALGPMQAAACTYRIALGPRAGQKVLSLQTVPTAQPTPGRCANAQGFSLHAEVCCAAHQRKKLEHLCRYITRPAIANERLALNRAGQVVLTLKTPYRDGTTHLVMSPLEFMQRLAALVPRPRLHLIRFHGVLAPNARLRPHIIPNVPVNANTPSADHAELPPPAAPASMSWARLLKRVFEIDIKHCPQCGGTLKIIAAIEHPPVITKILTHLGLPARAPPRAAARAFDRFQLA